MLRKIAAVGVSVLTMCAATLASAEEKETWKGPFGGTFSFGITVATDYSYRGISQTMRNFAVQPTFTYETPTVSEQVPIWAYVGFWGSNVDFPNTNTAVEIDLITGLRAKALNDKLTVDLGYIRYNYPGSDSALFYNFSEYGLVVGYDFDVVQLSGAIRYSPNFFANSGNAWYKWASATVPLPFIKINDNVSFKLFGTIGTQYVERNTFYGIPRNDYWDWQIGTTVTVYGFDLTAAYTDTNIESQDCGMTGNCDARVIFSIGKTF